jgi:hypothetical protein
MKPWITFLLMLTMATSAHAQFRGGGMRGGGFGMGGIRGHSGSSSIGRIPPVVSPLTPGSRGIASIPPVVRPLPTVNRGIGFQTGLARHGFVGTGFGNAFGYPGFGALAAARQIDIGPTIGFYPFSYPYTYPFPYTPPLGSPYYPATYPGTYIDPSIVQSYDNTTDNLVDEVQQLRNQVQQLTDELTMTRAYAVEPEPAVCCNPEPPEPPGPPSVLVFNNGQRIETRGYAISGTRVWALDDNSVRKFSLSELNVPQTQIENERRGIDFKLPEQ